MPEMRAEMKTEIKNSQKIKISMDALACQLKGVQEEKGDIQEKIKATIRSGQEEMKVGMDAKLEQLNAGDGKMTVRLEPMKACLGKTEARMQTV